MRDILQGVEDVHFSTLTSADVVRHRLVGEIVDAYAKWDEEQKADQVPHNLHPRRAGRRR